jgi:hypothetical protein
MKKSGKIIILICYYGKFPWYFPFFLHSCKYNPTVDFIIITGNNYEQEIPPNVQIMRLPFEELKEIISQKLSLSVQIKFPYKLCDFKPAYGLIFSESIKDYDFWGHGDIDVIFGNIRKFITDDLLSSHDLICVRHDFLTGYFTLFRNSTKMNTLYECSKDYKKVFTTPNHYCFDETNFAFEPFTAGVPVDEIPSEIESMTHVAKKMHQKGYINAYFNFHVIEGNEGKLKWEDGILTYKDEFEAILFHMIKFKNICEPIQIEKIPNTFYISSNSIQV